PRQWRYFADAMNDELRKRERDPALYDQSDEAKQRLFQLIRDTNKSIGRYFRGKGASERVVFTISHISEGYVLIFDLRSDGPGDEEIVGYYVAFHYAISVPTDDISIFLLHVKAPDSKRVIRCEIHDWDRHGRRLFLFGEVDSVGRCLIFHFRSSG